MFINDQDHVITDFLKAVNFIAPQGMSLKYFIVPYAANTEGLASVADQNGFLQDISSNAQNVPGITDTITYAKKDYSKRQSFNDSNFNLNQIPNEYPITKQAPSLEPSQIELISSGTNIKSPVNGIKVLESTRTFSDILLKESIGVFPKNTLLHFEVSKILS